MPTNKKISLKYLSTIGSLRKVKNYHYRKKIKKFKFVIKK